MTRESGNNAALEEVGEWEGLWAGDEGSQLSQPSFLQVGFFFFCAKHSQAQSSHGSLYWGTWSPPLGATNKMLKDSSNQGCLGITLMDKNPQHNMEAVVSSTVPLLTAFLSLQHLAWNDFSSVPMFCTSLSQSRSWVSATLYKYRENELWEEKQSCSLRESQRT